MNAHITQEESSGLGEFLKMSPAEEKIIEEVKRWNSVEGDKTHRLDYDLNEESIVFDLGGYLGDWSAAIYCMYSPHIFVFEPIQYYHDLIEKRFKKSYKVQAFNYALLDEDAELSITLRNDATSLFKGSDLGVPVNIKQLDILKFLNSNNLNRIDLLKLNVEGSEYAILERLVSSGWIHKIKHVQVQFHDFMDSSKERRDNIRRLISQTHEEKYNFEFVWEGWTRK